LVFLNW